MDRADVTIGARSWAAHPLRAGVLGEVHARPFHAMATPRRVLHFGFANTGHASEAHRAALAAFCDQHGLPLPPQDARHFRVGFGECALRFEQHSEFTTYTIESGDAQSAGGEPFSALGLSLRDVVEQVLPRGEMLVAIDLHLTRALRDAALESFDATSLAMSQTRDGDALFASDFRWSHDGFVRMIVLDLSLTPEHAGMLVQRLLEIETYRTFALLGLPTAQALGPDVSRIEQRLAALTEEMRTSAGLADNRRRLDELTELAAELEAGAASSLFRFGASRAYNDLVQLRLQSIAEQPVGGSPTWGQFLQRRMAPAIRTCAAMEDRQANLSRKLARAAQLLRTRVDIELEQQNGELLASMNTRARLQLRLQQTVEGLSVAAISYYVIGLVGYLLKGAHEAGYAFNPSIVTAIAVPVVVAAMWAMMRWIRHRHSD